MARKFTVIGLANFGLYLARELYSLGAEVLVIDRDQRVIADIKDKVSRAVVADAVNKDTLLELGVDNSDCAIIGLHSRIDSSILLAMFLAEMKIPEIIAVAENEDHTKILKRIGAHKVIFPEKDLALRMARALLNPDMLDHIPLGPEHSILEVNVPESFWGKTIAELNIRKNYGFDVIAIKTPHPLPEKKTKEPTFSMDIAPSAQTTLKSNQSMLILGKKDAIKKIEKL